MDTAIQLEMNSIGDDGYFNPLFNPFWGSIE